MAETLLTTTNVNPTQFGKLFSQTVIGLVYAQPLYASQVTIPGKGVHNVVYVATTRDFVYAFDADDNGGTESKPLWTASLATGSLKYNFGVVGTPVIDLTSNTMYVVSSETAGSAYQFRLHALDITTGAEKFGGPAFIQGSVTGTGSGSSGGTLVFDPSSHFQRPGLLLLNGVVYIAFGSVNDNGPWHGWVFSYNASNLQQINYICTSPNGAGAGFWMGGAGLAAEVATPSKPYGRMFLVSGNGDYNAKTPFTNKMSYAMSVLDLDLTGGIMTVQDIFTPFNHTLLDAQDGDLGSGGVVLLPAQTQSSGTTLNPLLQVGKSGLIHVLDRNNLGGYNSSGDNVVQEVQTPQSGANNWGEGVWGQPAYWNNSVYIGGAQPGGTSAGVNNSLTAYSFTKGRISTSPTSKTVEQFSFPGPTPAISANGTTNGIVWVMKNDAYTIGGTAIMLAYDATNLGNLLYSTNANLSRDNPGLAVKFTVPTVANGKVYVGANGQLSVYGLFANTQTAPPPVISPGSSTFTGSQTVTITDSAPNAKIFYTTDGSTPTVASTPYTGPFAVNASLTITAIASATDYLQSAPASATFSSTANAANPVFGLAAGEYTGTQTVSISDSSIGAAIYYTVDGSKPTTASHLYTQPIAVSVSETVRAIATAPSLQPSSVVAAAFTIDPLYTIDFRQGFSQAQGPIQFNGSTSLDDFRLQLTNGGLNQAGSAFYTTPVNIQQFTTDFTFQLSNPGGDGFTFTIQNNNAGALGSRQAGLGYTGIHKSVAIKFDLYSNAGEGTNSTGLYTAGNSPTVPSINLAGTGIDLHSGDYINAHITYDGIDLVLTLTDAITLTSWSHTFPIDIPGQMHGNNAYVGFTGSTGTLTASQKLTYWTYVAGPPSVPNFPTGFDSASFSLNSGAKLTGSWLELTDGGSLEASSAYFPTPVNIQSFTNDFDFQLTSAVADGFTFTIQNASPTAVGGGGGGLGYATIPNSAAVKFDFFNNNGEGTDSTGFYVNGAAPILPSMTLSNTKVVLNNGNVFHVHMTYDGTTLTWSLTDLGAAGHDDATESVVVNLPQTIGSNTAYIGFTAASGTLTAIQNILDWTYTAP